MTSEGAVMTEPSDEFLWKVRAYTNEFIRFADTKAALVVAWTSALVSGQFGLKARHRLRPARFAPLRIDWLEAFGAFWAVVAFASRADRVCDRDDHCAAPPVDQEEDGFIFWENVLGHASSDAWLLALTQEADLKKHVADLFSQLRGSAAGSIAVFNGSYSEKSYGCVLD
jgi:hypothetical protein